jgi:hypothetical protein
MPFLGSRASGSAGGYGQRQGAALLIQASGGTITYEGDYAIHTFTSPGTFAVQSIRADVPAPEQSVDYLVVGAGGGSGQGWGGGSGAGGARMSAGTTHGGYTVGPLGTGVAAIPISATSYPITVGSGGTAGKPGTNGSPSSFSTITSAGGGGGHGEGPNTNPGQPGGSGGGAGGNNGPGQSGGSGNTPSVSPSQGNPGGSIPGYTNGQIAGGGGATGSGQGQQWPEMSPGSALANGGTGVQNLIAGPTGGDPAPAGNGYWASGGGGPGNSDFRAGGGGSGQDSTGTVPSPIHVGRPNTGGGAMESGGTGGSGAVVLRYKYK